MNAHIESLVKQITQALPADMDGISDDVKQHIKTALTQGLNRLDMVSREEFDVQRAVLLRTREKLELLERMVLDLEAKLSIDPDASRH